MKKYFIGAAMAAAILLSGCASENTAAAEDGAIVVASAGIRVELPQGWNIITGNAVYDEIYEQYSDSYGSAKELREDFETAGQYYIAYAISASGTAIVTVSVQDMTVASDGEAVEERPTAEDYARTVHDSTIFEYLASGYRTGSDSSFSQETYAGKSGWLSYFEVYLPQEDSEELTFVLGQEEFMFEQGDNIFSVQMCYSDEHSRDEVKSVIQIEQA